MYQSLEEKLRGFCVPYSSTEFITVPQGTITYRMQSNPFFPVIIESFVLLQVILFIHSFVKVSSQKKETFL